MDGLRPFISEVISSVLNRELTVSDFSMQGGGCINSTAAVTTAEGRFFVKWNKASLIGMFEREANGLSLLAATHTILTPKVHGHGVVGDKSFLIMDFIERGSPTQRYWQSMGEQLAALHLIEQPAFGLEEDNYIGSLEQFNKPASDWLSFYTESRLRAQLNIAKVRGFVNGSFINDFEALLKKLPHIMPPSQASLLHGDLWNGNVMPGRGDEACYYDPAVYRGAREMDLAMTRLFGGFDQQFYEAYHHVNPIPGHFEELMELYQLYPLMVHVNLFGPGSGYLDSVKLILSRFL
jgi:fructosamine-3-kinase